MIRKNLRQLLGMILMLLILPKVGIAADSSQRESFHLGQSTITIHFDSPFTSSEKSKLLRWLRSAAETMTTLYGEFPVANTEVHVIRSRSNREPVPWGEVWKDGSYRINFHVNPKFSLEDFLDDWTAPHEFSHLFHPYPGRGNAWFGEGLASYYQNILRVRYGSMSEEQAFQKLYNGFQRGVRNQNSTGLDLKKSSANMRIYHSYMHVYWGGASYFLNVDVKLRKRSAGKQSLDTVWLGFKRCCLNPNLHWPLPKLIEKLDQLSNSTIFSDEYQHIISTPGFPNFQESFKALGIDVRNQQLHFSQSGPTRELRRLLVSPAK